MYEAKRRSEVSRGATSQRAPQPQPRRWAPNAQRKADASGRDDPEHPGAPSLDAVDGSSSPPPEHSPAGAARGARSAPTIVPNAGARSAPQRAVPTARQRAAQPATPNPSAVRPSLRYTIERGVLPAAALKPPSSSPQRRASGAAPRLEAPPLSTQTFSDPAQDPAERQADAIGARIGHDLSSAESVPSGSISGGTRAVAEKHLGVNLEGTELRDDTAAHERASEAEAVALTEGSRVSFAKGRLSSESEASRALIGHELTHVAQQRVHGFGEPEADSQRATDPIPHAQAALRGPDALPGAPGPTPEPAVEDPAKSHELDATTKRIVEDAEASETTSSKSEFLARLRQDLEQMVDDELHGTPFTGKNCPWILHYIALYQGLPVEHLRSAIARFVPGLAPGVGVEGLRRAAVERAREGVRRWRDSGEQPTTPPGTRPGHEPPPLEAPVVQRKASDAAPPPAEDPTAVLARLGPGTPLDAPVRSSIESSFGTSFDDVRVHTDPAGQREASRQRAHAFTVGQHVGFAAGSYRPGTLLGDALIAHELAHVVQQSRPGQASEAAAERDAERAVVQAGLGEAAPQARSGLRLQRCADAAIPEEEPLTGRAEPGRPLDAYTQSGQTYHPGDAAGPNILTRIDQHDDGSISFEWYTFSANAYNHGGIGVWQMLEMASFGAGSDFERLGKQLPAAQWRELGDDPGARLLALHDQGKITMPDSTLFAAYKGMIYLEAVKTLDRNEAQVDELLNAPDRLARFKDYAEGLKEASIIRDQLEAKRADIEHSLTQAHAPGIGYAGRFQNMDPARRLAGMQELGPVQDAIAFWRASFPLLTRLKTDEISPDRILSTLVDIKSNIASTRKELELARIGQGSLDLFELGPVRANLQHQLGPRSGQTIAAEDTRRGIQAWVETGVLVAGSIVLLFIPGGVIIDAAIGIALGIKSVNDAITLRRAADAGEDVEAGLVSQAQANMATFGAVLSVIGAVATSISAGFRILKFARGFRAVSAAAPGLSVAGRARIASLVARHPEIIASPRTTAGLRQSLESLKIKLGPEELIALRNLSFGGKAPGTSAEGLETFLDQVWNDRQRILASSDPENAVYRIYSQATEKNVLATQAAREQYIDEIAKLAESRPPGALSNTQIARSPERLGNQISGLVRDPAKRAALIQSEYFRFEREGITREMLQRGIAQERVYINATAEHATDTMGFVVKNIVDDANRFPGVVMAKLAAPGTAARKSDVIVIYLEKAEDAERVLTALRDYQAAHPERFMNNVPAMTEKMSRGVAVGSEPIPSLQGLSFGEARANPIAEALRKASSREDFGRQARELLRQNGVDLDFPNLNAPPPGPAGGFVGPPTPGPGTLAGPTATGAGEAGRRESKEGEK